MTNIALISEKKLRRLKEGEEFLVRAASLIAQRSVNICDQAGILSLLTLGARETEPKQGRDYFRRVFRSFVPFHCSGVLVVRM